MPEDWSTEAVGTNRGPALVVAGVLEKPAEDAWDELIICDGSGGRDEASSPIVVGFAVLINPPVRGAAHF
jgi:hypothetical protein